MVLIGGRTNTRPANGLLRGSSNAEVWAAAAKNEATSRIDGKRGEAEIWWTA
jgi:hypothetical protein